MKKLIAIFAVFFVCIAQNSVHCEDSDDVARAARKNSTSVVAAATRKNNADTVIDSRSNKTSVGANNSERGATVSPRTNVIEQSRAAKTQKTISARNATSVQNRNSADKKVSGRAPRSATAAQTNRSVRGNNTFVNSSTASRSAKKTNNTKISRAAATQTKDKMAPTASTFSYTKCKEVYYSCMDEFCANKDTQLKRCACSARVNDFDEIKEILAKAEEELQNFNERLLSVNMEAEDAMAMVTATEGELAYAQDDESESKKILNEISDKLEAETTSSGKDSLTLTLDKAAAFDSLDSTLGSSVTSKSGAGLYNAALPICQEMAMEVCDEASAAIVESGYQMAIEKDCNTVETAYENLTGAALAKTNEGSSLLDMSRLDIYQKRNSDDALTCRKKMLDAIYDPAVCGEDLIKCLDITGKYIDPGTGEAFLTKDLVNLSTAIIRPTENQTWTTVSNNKDFVYFLENKKEYLESAMANCQDISSVIWDDFIEDAMAQIKLAQVVKLEEMRESCTTLTTECLSDSKTSITDFDSRALSIFGVTADKTVNAMCYNVKEACTALLETQNSDADWAAGMNEIQTATTYDSIMETCREVGKACIIEQCTSISGNFGLCEDIEGSVNRQNIVTLNSDCWNEVLDCVSDAGSDPINDIMTYFGKDKTSNGGTIGDFYTEIYGSYIYKKTTSQEYDTTTCDMTSGEICIYDVCGDTCASSSAFECEKCRIAEKIWGNCEYIPTHSLKPVDSTNKILPADDEDNQTLLGWFAESTGTDLEDYNCSYTNCAPGFTAIDNGDGTISCLDSSNVTSDNQTCISSEQITISNAAGWTNCCETGVKDTFGNCCMGGSNTYVSNTDLTITNTSYFGITGTSSINQLQICRPNSTYNAKLISAFYISVTNPISSYNYYEKYGPGMNYLICLSTESGSSILDSAAVPGWPQGQTIECNGQFIVVNSVSGTYIDPMGSNFAKNYYSLDVDNSTTCTLGFGTNPATWTKTGTYPDEDCDKVLSGSSYYYEYPTANDNNLLIGY